jgi:Tfp pilus assembly protein PilV
MTHARVGRRGFTLVETLVALVLFQLGMLALVATAGVAARDLAEAVARRRAQGIAAAHAEMLRAAACRGAQAGSALLTAGMVESWRVEVVGAARSVTDSIDVPLPRGRRAAVVARTWTVCAL